MYDEEGFDPVAGDDGPDPEDYLASDDTSAGDPIATAEAQAYDAWNAPPPEDGGAVEAQGADGAHEAGTEMEPEADAAEWSPEQYAAQEEHDEPEGESSYGASTWATYESSTAGGADVEDVEGAPYTPTSAEAAYADDTDYDEAMHEGAAELEDDAQVTDEDAPEPSYAVDEAAYGIEAGAGMGEETGDTMTSNGASHYDEPVAYNHADTGNGTRNGYDPYATPHEDTAETPHVTYSASYRIGMKDAIRIAREYIREIYAIEGTSLPGLLLEEAELSADGECWNVTYGFDTDRPGDRASVFASSQNRTVREYKYLSIDAASGEVLSLKIRKV